MRGLLSAWLTVLASAAACRVEPSASPAPADTPELTRAWRYHARLAAEARTLAVDLCFDGPPPPALVALVPEAWGLIAKLRIRGRDAALHRDGDRVSLAGLSPSDCVSYQVDLTRVGSSGWRGDGWVGDSVLVRQSRLLLWPSVAARDPSITFELAVPPGVSASVPWTPLDSAAGESSDPGEGLRTYRVPSTVARWLGYAAFGRLNLNRFSSHGAQVEIACLDKPIASDQAGLRRWIDDAIASTALIYGEFPRDRVQVLVSPTEGTRGTVYFGMAYRGGGSGVYLLLDTQAQGDSLLGGWTTVHEFLHHGMPFVREPWMGEGFVSYYTEVVRTRMGHRDELQGWAALHEAFMRGRDDRPGLGLARASQAMHLTRAYQRVYWGGAAIAFDLDVSLRLDSDNRVGLDDAMVELHRCCAHLPRQLAAQELLAKLDTWYGKPLFSRIARAHLDAGEFPPVDDMFARLGIHMDGQTPVLDPDHPAAAVRRSIMAGSATVPRHGERVATQHRADPGRGR